jgi:hypothetical protein
LRRVAAEKQDVSKTILAIGGLGAGGCLLLSLLMQHALQAQQERKKAPLAQLLEVEFEGRRVGPVRVDEVRQQGRMHLSVRLSVRAGQPKQRIAESAGAIAWDYALASRTEPADVVVEVGDDVLGAPAIVSVPRPARRP